MADIGTVIDGNPLDADLDWNPMATKVNDHDARLLAVEKLGRITGDTFSTDLVSSGSTEVVGYSQKVNLVSGGLYRVWFKGLMNAGATGNVGMVRIRYDTAALSVSSSLADQAQLPHVASGTFGRETLFFAAEFTAPSSAEYNIGVGVLTASGTGNETIVSSTTSTKIWVDRIG